MALQAGAEKEGETGGRMDEAGPGCWLCGRRDGDVKKAEQIILDRGQNCAGGEK